jgi:hypothetical protein
MLNDLLFSDKVPFAASSKIPSPQWRLASLLALFWQRCVVWMEQKNFLFDALH